MFKKFDQLFFVLDHCDELKIILYNKNVIHG